MSLPQPPGIGNTVAQIDCDRQRLFNPITPANGSARTARDAARHYLACGVYTVPVKSHDKKPWDFERGRLRDAWEQLRVTEADIDRLFAPDSNIGIILGEPSGGLVDVDLDCVESRHAATHLLPPTGMVGGRDSAANSHYFFVTDNPPAKASDAPKDPITREKLLELRSTGGHTVVAPSILSLRGEKLTDDSMKEIAALRSLTTLNISVCHGVTSGGFKHLIGLPNLSTLNLAYTALNDAGLKELAAIQTLTSLNLGQTKVTNAGMKEVGKLKNLTYLSLGATGITDDGIKELHTLKELTQLDLFALTVTHEGLKGVWSSPPMVDSV